MRVTFYGTRGSTPTARADQRRFGGNTTCLRVESDCIPDGWGIVVDSGSGFTQLSHDLISSHPQLCVLYTHYHHDHTQGIFLAPHVFAPHASMRLYGPHEHDIGPKEVMERLFHQPLFPVEYAMVSRQIVCRNLKHIGTQVLVVHPEAGFHVLPIAKYHNAVEDGDQLSLGTRRESVRDCLVITMFKTVHPEYTVSYRFNEMPTGKQFVFLTDHENTAGIPKELGRHVADADLLVQDAQYSKEVYLARTAGFGHGTPEYCAILALSGRVKRLGLTHHDPTADDSTVETRVYEAERYRQENDNGILQEVFGCADNMLIEV